jgi:recombination protein RecA
VLFDEALGGGWPRARIVNVIGDKSVGKTGLAIEACANYALLSKASNVRYGEAESAFDDQYAEQLGMPKGVSTPKEPLQTIEDFSSDLNGFLTPRIGKSGPSLYVLDSLDALSDAAEMKRDNEKGSYGMEKAKQLSKMFRILTGTIASADCTLFVISQVRDNIGVTYGQKHRRSGGNALNFYASQIVWLSQVKMLTARGLGVERPVGILVKAIARKNKVGLPFRQAELRLIFGYGIDDEMSMLDYIAEHNIKTGDQSVQQLRNAVSRARVEGDRKTLKDYHTYLAKITRRHWRAVEEAIAPPMRKYGHG